MNYSTLKKTVALSVVSLMAVGMVKAQTSTTTTTTTDSTKTSSETTTAKVFGGAGQYNTWSIGANVGATFPFLLYGGTNATRRTWTADLGFGVSLRKKIAHSFSVQLDVQGGHVKGDDGNNPNLISKSNGFEGQAFKTQFFSGTISGLVNVASVDFLHRKNSVNFYGSVGAGLIFYNPTWADNDGGFPTPISHQYTNSDGSKHWVKELVIPVGGLVKFRLTDALALNVGYTMNFIDGTNFSGFHTVKIASGQIYHDHYAYAYGGVEYTLGSKSKANLDWVNPVALMYDELYDAALRQEVEALKARVTNVEGAINDLKKDSDGDGVSDQFDKCPNTPAGTVVDGAGCAIVFPHDTVKPLPTPIAYSNIQFEFDSSVLRTSSYPVLDATSADLRTTGASSEIDGFASSEGTAAHNMRLSKDRANSVKTYLVNSGVDAKKLKIKGYGETHPIADNSTEEGRVLNRRVQFIKK